MAQERKSRSTTPRNQLNRRARQILQLRREIKTLDKQFKGGKKGGYKRSDSYTSGATLQIKKGRKVSETEEGEGGKASQVHQGPILVHQALLTEARSGKLTSPKKVVEAFYKESHSDLLRNQGSSAHPKIGSTNAPEESLDTREPTWREVHDIVQQTHSASAPGPSGIPYKVYKKCLMLLRRKLLRKIWIKGSIPAS